MCVCVLCVCMLDYDTLLTEETPTWNVVQLFVGVGMFLAAPAVFGFLAYGLFIAVYVLIGTYFVTMVQKDPPPQLQPQAQKESQESAAGAKSKKK